MNRITNVSHRHNIIHSYVARKNTELLVGFKPPTSIKERDREDKGKGGSETKFWYTSELSRLELRRIEMEEVGPFVGGLE